MMRRIPLLVALIAGLALATGTSAGARGPAHTQLADRGWACITAGPHGWVHCFPPGSGASDRSIPVLVFDTTDTTVDGPLLGTELLIHDDVFAGQPCPQDGGVYEPVAGTPYWACHHFAR